MVKNMDLVSVIMAARDEEMTIDRSIGSLLSQTYKNIEIIVIDDGSTDKTPDIVKGIAKTHKNVIYKRIEFENKGCVRPRYIGIEETKGEVIFVVDADAKYDSDYVEKCVAHLARKDVGGVIGRLRVWDPKTFISKYRDVMYRLRFDDFDNLRQELKDGKHAAWIFRRSDYERLGKYNLNLAYGEDRDFTKRLLDEGFVIAYETEAFWYHRWKEFLGEVMTNNFEMGEQNYGFNKRNVKVWGKVLYFLSGVALFFAGFFNALFFGVLLVHMMPLFVNGVKIFIKAGGKGYTYRKYALLAPAVSYVYNVPYSVGFVVEAVRGIFGIKKF